MIVSRIQESKCSVWGASYGNSHGRAAFIAADASSFSTARNDESRTQRAAGSGFHLMYGDAGIRTRVRLLDPPRPLRAYPAVLFSSSAHRPAGGPSRTSRESLARAVTAPNAGQPEFIDTRRPASGRADRKMGGKEPVRASTYAARAKLSFAGKVSWRFNECSKHLGTLPRIHRTRRNLSSPNRCFQSTP